MYRDSKGDENTLDFTSHGRTRLRNPTLFLRNANPKAIVALAYWLSNPEVSTLSDKALRRMLLFDLAGQHKDNCWCGRVTLKTSGTLSPSICCPSHDPAVATSLICFAEFQMTKLQHEITKCLLISCGIDQVVEEQDEVPKLPYSFAFHAGYGRSRISRTQFSTSGFPLRKMRQRKDSKNLREGSTRLLG